MDSRARLGPWIDAAVCALVAASVAYSYAVYARLALTRPALSDYEQAAAHIRSNWRPGDLINVSPFWATRVREYLGDLPLQGLRHPGRDDLTRYRRLWLFSVFGAPRRDPIQSAAEALPVMIEERQFGRVSVRLYDVRAHEPIRYDFREALGEARVFLERGGARQPCARGARERWQCSMAAWNYVGREIFEMEREPRAVIWAHPVSNAALSIEFDRVPLGRALVLGAGFTPAGSGLGAPVELTVEADGRVLRRRVYGPGSGFARERIDTSDLAEGLHRVTFRVTTLDDRMRHFCFSADTRG